MLRTGFANRVLPFDSGAARAYAGIAAARRRMGRPISQADGQITAIARFRGTEARKKRPGQVRVGGLRNETREQSTPAERRTHHECVPPDREQAVARERRTMQRPAGGTQSADSVEQGGRNGPGTGSIRFRHVKRDPQVSVNLSVDDLLR